MQKVHVFCCSFLETENWVEIYCLARKVMRNRWEQSVNSSQICSRVLKNVKAFLFHPESNGQSLKIFVEKNDQICILETVNAGM